MHAGGREAPGPRAPGGDEADFAEDDLGGGDAGLGDDHAQEQRGHDQAAEVLRRAQRVAQPRLRRLRGVQRRQAREAWGGKDPEVGMPHRSAPAGHSA